MENCIAVPRSSDLRVGFLGITGRDIHDKDLWFLFLNVWVFTKK